MGKNRRTKDVERSTGMGGGRTESIKWCSMDKWKQELGARRGGNDRKEEKGREVK